jgi:hypothetical protein
MNDWEFLDYEAMPEEQYLSGIATVRFMRRLIIKYKIVNKKDGSGFFISPFNTRVGSTADDYRYIDSVIIDSRSENDDVLQMIRKNVNMCLHGGSPQTQQTQVGETNYQPNLDSCPF